MSAQISSEPSDFTLNDSIPLAYATSLTDIEKMAAYKIHLKIRVTELPGEIEELKKKGPTKSWYKTEAREKEEWESEIKKLEEELASSKIMLEKVCDWIDLYEIGHLNDYELSEFIRKHVTLPQTIGLAQSLTTIYLDMVQDILAGDLNIETFCKMLDFAIETAEAVGDEETADKLHEISLIAMSVKEANGTVSDLKEALDDKNKAVGLGTSDISDDIGATEYDDENLVAANNNTILPDWFKTNVKWVKQGKLPKSALLPAIESMMIQNIIPVDRFIKPAGIEGSIGGGYAQQATQAQGYGSSSAPIRSSLPDYSVTVLGLWADGQTSSGEIGNHLGHLMSSGVINSETIQKEITVKKAMKTAVAEFFEAQGIKTEDKASTDIQVTSLKKEFIDRCRALNVVQGVLDCIDSTTKDAIRTEGTPKLAPSSLPSEYPTFQPDTVLTDDHLKSLQLYFETATQNEVSMKYLQKIKSAEYELIKNSYDIVLDDYAKNKDQNTMKIMTSLGTAEKKAKDDSLRATKILNTAVQLAKDAKSAAIKSGLSVLDLEKSVVDQQFEIDSMKKTLKTESEIKSAYNHALKSQEKANEGLQKTTHSVVGNDPEYLTLSLKDKKFVSKTFDLVDYENYWNNPLNVIYGVMGVIAVGYDPAHQKQPSPSNQNEIPSILTDAPKNPELITSSDFDEIYFFFESMEGGLSDVNISSLSESDFDWDSSGYWIDITTPDDTHVTIFQEIPKETLDIIFDTDIIEGNNMIQDTASTWGPDGYWVDITLPDGTSVSIPPDYFLPSTSDGIVDLEVNPKYTTEGSTEDSEQTSVNTPTEDSEQTSVNTPTEDSEQTSENIPTDSTYDDGVHGPFDQEHWDFIDNEAPTGWTLEMDWETGGWFWTSIDGGEMSDPYERDTDGNIIRDSNGNPTFRDQNDEYICGDGYRVSNNECVTEDEYICGDGYRVSNNECVVDTPTEKIKINNADGTQTITYPDGTSVWLIHSGQSAIITYPDGSTERSAIGFTTTMKVQVKIGTSTWNFSTHAEAYAAMEGLVDEYLAGNTTVSGPYNPNQSYSLPVLTADYGRQYPAYQFDIVQYSSTCNGERHYLPNGALYSATTLSLGYHSPVGNCGYGTVSNYPIQNLTVEGSVLNAYLNHLGLSSFPPVPEDTTGSYSGSTEPEPPSDSGLN